MSYMPHNKNRKKKKTRLRTIQAITLEKGSFQKHDTFKLLDSATDSVLDIKVHVLFKF